MNAESFPCTLRQIDRVSWIRGWWVGGLWVVGVLSETVNGRMKKIREGFFACVPASLETIRMGDTVGHLPAMGRRRRAGEGEGNLESNYKWVNE